MFVLQRVNGEIKKLAEAFNALRRLVFRNVIQRCHELQILPTRERFEHCARFRHISNDSFDVQRILHHIKAADLGRARSGQQHARQHLDCGALAGAVRAQQADQLSGGNVKVELVDGDLRAE